MAFIVRSKLSLASALSLGFLSLVVVGGIPGEPFRFTFDPGGAVTDDGGGTYQDGIDGVSAQFPGTGNFVVDPDASARRNVPKRYVRLDFASGTGGPLTGPHRAFFMSINAIGKKCDGAAFSTAPRDLDLGECIQVNVGLNDIYTEAGTPTGYLLRCGDSQSYDATGLDNAVTTCVSEAGTPPNNICTRWVIEPLPNGVLRCALFKYPKPKDGPQAGLIRSPGTYDMHFTASVERP